MRTFELGTAGAVSFACRPTRFVGKAEAAASKMLVQKSDLIAYCKPGGKERGARRPISKKKIDRLAAPDKRKKRVYECRSWVGGRCLTESKL